MEISVDTIDVGSFEEINFQKFEEVIDGLAIQEEVSAEELFPVTKALTIDNTSMADLVREVTMTVLTGPDCKPVLNNRLSHNNINRNNVNVQSKPSSNKINKNNSN